MRNESVALLDVRSYEITFFLGLRGVNDTFVFCGSHTEKYEGFSTEGFFDVVSFREAVKSAVNHVKQNYGGVIDEVYVGVPSNFLSLCTKGHTISFAKKRKISLQDVDALYDSGLCELLSEEHCIRRFAMYFTLGDNRKYFFPEELRGVHTRLLKGALCYYFIREDFHELAVSVLGEMGFERVRFLPASLAQAMYLLPEKRREGYAFLLDVGFLTTSIAVVYGNGIVHEETFDFGKGAVIAAIMQALDVDYQTAEEILLSANVSGGSVPKDLTWTSERGDLAFPVQRINDIIKTSLDVLCENVENFFSKYYNEKNMTAFAVNPVSVTGEGIAGIAGITEHLSARLNRLTEVVAPELPYYDKPAFSSRIALMNMALNDRKARGFWQRIFNKNGGKRK